MTIQTSIRPAMICNFTVALSQPIHASSRDYGFDFDQEEIGRELLAPLAINLSIQPMPEALSEEFESRYLHFVS